MAIIIGAKYKLIRHPQQPIGTVTTTLPSTKQVVIRWDNMLIPPESTYDEDLFANGTFEFVNYGDNDSRPYWVRDMMEKENAVKDCTHEWATYSGFREYYEFCKKCDIKRSV